MTQTRDLIKKTDLINDQQDDLEREVERLCPKLLVREEGKAIVIGTGDIIVSYFQPCLKEKCMAYSGGHCAEYPVSGSIYYKPQESEE